MGFQVGNFSLLATKSMHSVDSWLATIQANLNGSTRNAFKESEITYGGNITYQLKNNRPEKAGEQIAEQVLTTGHTKVNWAQGSMVSSTQDTHFAIQGEGFFAVTSTAGIAGNPADFVRNTGTLTYFGNNVYLTRDGEFHFSIIPNISTTDPVLVDKNGLAVLSDAGPATSDNVYHFIFKSNFDSPTTRSGAVYNGLNAERPSVVQPSYDPSFTIGAPVTVTDVNELVYSSYGSTYFQAPTANIVKTIINGTDEVLDRRVTAATASSSLLIEKQLEASNTKVEKNIVEMSILGKVYNGFVQVIKMYNANIDEMLNFIR